MARWNLFQKAAVDRKPSDTPKHYDTFYLNSGMGVALVKCNDTIMAKSAMSHPIVYRALNKIAESVQQVAWFAEEDPTATASERRDKTTFIAHLNSVLRNPNNDMTPEMVRYWMALNYASYGRIPLKVSFSAMDPKMPSGLFPLQAEYTTAKYNNQASVVEYEYGAGTEKQLYTSRHVWKVGTKGGFVDQIWKPAFRGHQHPEEVNSPLRAIGLPAQVIRSLLIRAIQTAEGHPNVRYLVTCDRVLTENQKKALRAHLNEDHGTDGPDAGKVPVLNNVGNLEIHKLDNDLSDIHSKMPSDDMARLIFGAFGIPIALAGMGAADGAKFAGNYSESRLSFWQDTVLPGYITPIFSGLTRMLCPPGVRISPDLDSIPALLVGRIYAMKEANGVMFLTTTEKRALFGFEKNDALPETPIPASTAIGSLTADKGDTK